MKDKNPDSTDEWHLLGHKHLADQGLARYVHLESNRGIQPSRFLKEGFHVTAYNRASDHSIWGLSPFADPCPDALLRTHPLSRDHRSNHALGGGQNQRPDLHTLGHTGHLPLPDPQQRSLLSQCSLPPQVLASRLRVATLFTENRQLLQSPANACPRHSCHDWCAARRSVPKS